jgi:hypothetical protein
VVSEPENGVESPWSHAGGCACVGGDVNRDTSHLLSPGVRDKGGAGGIGTCE